ncbi:MAG: hypothetical protein KBT32_09785 [Bacteroidales bacterium]|nr:hypothetical protein [Candidatus Physcocola equi]
MLTRKDIFIIRTFFILFWVLGCFGFIYQELIPPFESLFTPINVMADLLIVLLGIMCISHKFQILYLSVFIVISLVSTCVVNELSLSNWVYGMRVFISILFLPIIFRYIWDKKELFDKFSKDIDKHLIAWLLLQALCVTEQFFRYGPGDHGGGSIGDSASNIISISIYFFSFFLMRKRIDPHNVFQSIKKNIWIVILLFPSFLNETKVSFIFFIMYITLLFPIDKKYVKRLILIIPPSSLILGSAFWLYMSTVDRAEDMTSPTFLMEEYLYGDYTVDELAAGVDWILENETNIPDMPRFTKIAFIPYIIEQNSNNWFFGNGTVGFNGSIDNPNLPKSIQDSNWFYFGTNPTICNFVVQVGILGTLTIFWILWMLYSMRIPNYTIEKNIKIYSFICFIILLFYSDILKTPICGIIFFMFLFLAWKPDEKANSLESSDQQSETAEEIVQIS